MHQARQAQHTGHGRINTHLESLEGKHRNLCLKGTCYVSLDNVQSSSIKLDTRYDCLLLFKRAHLEMNPMFELDKQQGSKQPHIHF